MVTKITAMAAVMSIAGVAAAQDPTKTLPDSYKVELENAYVKVVRVHYDAGAKLATHTHPAGQTAYIYLNDSDGIVFRHSGTRSHVVNRPPVKMGAVRFTTGSEPEDHTAENTSAAASDFLRVMIKTDNPRGEGRRLKPTEMQYENQQLRVTRHRVASGGTLLLQESDKPSLLVAFPSGKQFWMDPHTPLSIITHDSPDLEFLRFEFLTAPK